MRSACICAPRRIFRFPIKTKLSCSKPPISPLCTKPGRAGPWDPLTSERALRMDCPFSLVVLNRTICYKNYSIARNSLCGIHVRNAVEGIQSKLLTRGQPMNSERASDGSFQPSTSFEGLHGRLPLVSFVLAVAERQTALLELQSRKRTMNSTYISRVAGVPLSAHFPPAGLEMFMPRFHP